MKSIRAAAVQFNHVPGDKEANWKVMDGFIAEAREEGVELLVFPEMCITGYWHVRNLNRSQIEELSESVPEGPSSQRLSAAAKATGMSIGAGLIEWSEDGKFYNSFVVAMPDGRVVCHRKIHAFISQHIDSGDSVTVFELPNGVKAGILICYDNNVGENVRMTALQGAEVLIAPHQTGGCDSPSPRCMGSIDTALWQNREANPDAIEKEFYGSKGREWLLKWLPARAHDNAMFLIFSNGVGQDDDEVRTGNAMILDCYGDILAETWKAKDDMVVADLDLSLREMCTGKRWMKTRRPELYGALTKATGNEEDTRTIRFRRTAS